MNDQREVQTARRAHNHFHREATDGAVDHFIRRGEIELNIPRHERVDVVTPAERDHARVELSLFKKSLFLGDVGRQVHRAANTFTNDDRL